MKKILREPLLHFLLLGAAVFAAYGLVSKRSSGEPGRIVVTQGQVASMAVGFSRTWQRPPTARGAGGLDPGSGAGRSLLPRGDGARAGQGRHDHPPPSAAEDGVPHRRSRRPGPADRRRAARVSGRAPRHVSCRATVHVQPRVSQSRQAWRHVSRATPRQLLAHVESGRRRRPTSRRWAIRSCSTTPSRRCRPARWRNSSGKSSRRSWAKFRPANGKGRSSPATASHLVFVRERTEGRVPALEEVRDAVRREWANARRLEANEKLYEGMLKRYAVTIEEPVGEGQKPSPPVT